MTILFLEPTLNWTAFPEAVICMRRSVSSYDNARFIGEYSHRTPFVRSRYNDAWPMSLGLRSWVPPSW